MRGRTGFATIECGTEEGDYGVEVECVYATCCASGIAVGPIWGGGEASVRRALAELTEICECGATWHADEAA